MSDTAALPTEIEAADLAALVRTATERALSEAEAEAAFGGLVEGTASAVQAAALLVAMQTRGVAPSELAGGVRALRHAMVPVQVGNDAGLVDTCGTGGGALTTFNISTAAALLAAAAGVRIAKHGNRSFTSRSGSADVLEALGVRLDLEPEAQAQVLEQTGVVFMFAPLHHPAMRHVAPVRRELAMPTAMNLLGPLTNPARVRRQVVGVADPALLEPVARTLALLGHEHALVVHGTPGLDELSPLGISHGFEVRGGTVQEWSFDAGVLGWRFAPGELAGGSPEQNASLVERLLRGRQGGAARAAVALNAAAALYVGGIAASLEDGLGRAEQALDGGEGWTRLQALRAATEQHRPPGS